MFKLKLPPQCPPNEAAEVEKVLYRILKGDTMTDGDLLSYAENEADKYSNHCAAHGISLYERYEDAVKAYLDAKSRSKTLGTHVGKLQVQQSHGKLNRSGKGGHFTLWLYSQVDATKIACLEVARIKI